MAPQLPHLPQRPQLPKVPLTPRELGELAQLFFEWPIKQSPRLALPLFIVLAAIMQASVVILFSISYKEPLEKLPVPPQIYFLPADSAAARQLAPWLEANDPAVFSPLHAARDAFPSPPPLKYKPSYEDPPPPLRPLPEASPGSVTPPMIPTSGDLLRHQSRSSLVMEQAQANTNTELAAKTLTPPAAATPPMETSVQWQDELAGRVLQTPALKTQASLAMKPGAKAPLYQVAVSPEGIPMHCVLVDSSGDSRSDEAGRIWIMSQRFMPAASSSWGRVLILGGSEAPAASEPVTPPLSPPTP